MPKMYYIDHPEKPNYEIEIPESIRDQIVIDFLMRTYYWSVGIAGLIVGFLLGVAIK